MQNAVLKEKLAKARALAHTPALPGRVEMETLNNWRVSAGLMEARGRVLVVSVRHHVPEGHPLREAMERVRAGHETLLALLAGMEQGRPESVAQEVQA